MLAPFDALMKVMDALGFERQGSDIIHIESRQKLKAAWSEEAVEDLKHYHGIDGAQELATILMEQLWSITTTGRAWNAPSKS